MGCTSDFGLRAPYSCSSGGRTSNQGWQSAISTNRRLHTRFLASRDLPPVQLLAQRAFPTVVVPVEEPGSSHSSLEDQIDQFHFTEEGEVSARLVELSDSDSDLDHASTAPDLGLVIAQVDTSQEVEEKGMDLKQRSGLRGLLSNRNKGQSDRKSVV